MDRVLQRRDTAANWSTTNPILAEGEIGIITDGAKGYKIGDGVTRWNALEYPANPTSVVGELGNSEVAVINQKTVTDNLNSQKYILYPSTAIYGNPGVDYNHLANYSESPASFIGYVESDEYDCAWVRIFENSTTIKIEGAIASIVGYFSSLTPETNNFLGTGLTIPANAKLCLINFVKANNTSGYSNLKVYQEGMASSIKDVDTLDTNLNIVSPVTVTAVELASSFKASPYSKNILDTINVIKDWGFSDGQWTNLKGLISSGKLFLNDKQYYTIQNVKAYPTNLNVYIASFDIQDNYLGRTIVTYSSAQDLTATFLYNKLDNEAYVRIVLKGIDGSEDFSNMQLEEGVQATSIEQPKGFVFNKETTDFVKQSIEQYTEKPKGKNYIDINNLLYGWELANGQWVESANAISSNRLFLEDGQTYTMSNIAVYNSTLLNMYMAYFDRNGNYLKRTVHPLTVDSSGKKGNVTFKVTLDDAFYTRIVLKSSNIESVFVPTGQLEEGSTATAFEPYTGTNYKLNINTSVTVKDCNTLLTGASFAFSENEWFSYVCNSLGITGYNKAVSGETMQNTAQKMHDGTLYTQEEFEDFDIFLIFHSHNQIVTDATNLKENYEDYVFPLTDRSAQWDYVLKKYAAECYAARLNENSKWYGTKYGKPCRIVVCTHWHDARTIFNDSIRDLQSKWGFTLCELDKRIGFSKNQIHPVTGEQVSILHCDNPSGDTEVIDGVTYGWHPTRNKGAYIQHKIASIVESTLKNL